MARSTVPASAGQILQMIRSREVRTRRDLLELTGLSRSTLTQRLAQLQAGGYLREAGQRANSVGRPSGILTFDEASKLILVADLGATQARMALMDAAGGRLAQTTIELRIDRGPETVLLVVQETFTRLLEESGRSLDEVCGIGIGVPGPVDFDGGRVRFPPMMPGWHDFPIADTFTAAFDKPTFVDNDANLMGLGEYQLKYPDVPSLLFVKVGTGIGAGLILHGRPERGVAGGAGDVGHVRLGHPMDDQPCACGATGCLAVFASGGALARRLTARGIPACTSRDVVNLVTAGNAEAVAMVRVAGRMLGEVLATAVSLLNPAALIVGGDMAAAQEPFLNGVRAVLYERTVPLATRNLIIASSALGGRAGVEGARIMVVEQVFSEEAVDAHLRALPSAVAPDEPGAPPADPGAPVLRLATSS